jgi:hypothetical protein
MATTTTNFGWDIPQSTDLVKDGATAIAALGQDIDTALVDLKGGTTGQVLSKASNTDLDFTWVTDAAGDITGVTAGTGISGGGTSGTVTVTNSMATAIDAKGDLIGGTGADTFSRLAVGANGTVLTADSAEATGLKWATPSSGALTLIGTTTLSSSGSFNLSSIFSSTYDNYLIIASELVGSTADYFSFGLRTGTTNATSSYNAGQLGYAYTNTPASIGQTNVASIGAFDFNSGNTNAGGFHLKLENPFIAKSTSFHYDCVQYNYVVTRQGIHTVATSYDSLWFTVNAGTISGKVSVYGFVK